MVAIVSAGRGWPAVLVRVHAEHNSPKGGVVLAGSGGFVGLTAKFVAFTYA